MTDCFNHRVHGFDGNGKFVSKFGKKGILDLFNFSGSYPEGLSVNCIIVADKGNKVIRIFSSSGEYLCKFGGAGGANLVSNC